VTISDEVHQMLVAGSKVGAAWGATIFTVTLQDVQVVAHIVAVLLAAAYSATQLYVLWRDKIAHRRGSRK